MSKIQSYIDNGLGVIILSDSENGNRLDNNSLNEMKNVFDDYSGNKDVRVILLRSNGNNFCLGMNLDTLIKSNGNAELVIGIDLYIDILKNIHSCHKPVVCAVNGDVKAGGVGLVSSCDIIIASDKSSFELSEALFGLIPANVLPFIFSLRITPQKARYLILTAKKISAFEAKTINLVDEVFEQNMLEKGIKNVVKSLYRVSPDAVKYTKSFTTELLNLSFEESLVKAKNKLIELVETGDVNKAVTAFSQGDVPEWFSKFKPEKELI